MRGGSSTLDLLCKLKRISISMSRTPPEDVSRDFERGLGVPSDSGEQWRKGDDQFISRSSQIVDTREPGCVYMDHTSARLPTTYNSTDHMYVSRNLRTIYSPAVTGSYFLGFPGPEQWGKHEISASELGLQKKAIDCRLGMTASKSFSRDWGATTRWRVERKTSLLQRARRSETFTTIVPG